MSIEWRRCDERGAASTRLSSKGFAPTSRSCGGSSTTPSSFAASSTPASSGACSLIDRQAADHFLAGHRGRALPRFVPVIRCEKPPRVTHGIRSWISLTLRQVTPYPLIDARGILPSTDGPRASTWCDATHPGEVVEKRGL